ncbi:MAG: bifunctional 2-polyprenyl-6-hydroxyphenol methylase/3-demethylubiquinol 3-O-methyltransferase UbiG [Rhodospirillales bacterium]|nr:bifunctional 2-polyprenyl-6-hydroxyphenol methylase/3-demethylubiquinol 3-O-methyltransferase UbiG [Rhodospirillales bacterium]
MTARRKTKAPAKKPSTAASEEIARFSKQATAWWDESGPFAPLHHLNPTRIEFIRDHVAPHFGREPESERPLRNLALLDIGCGGGLIAEPMCRLGARVTGIDADKTAIETARRHARAGGLTIAYRCAAPEAIAEGKQRFDIVLALEVVEHVADLDAFMAACAAVLKPGGAVVASTLNRTARSFLLAKVGAEYLLRWLPVGTHDWQKFVKPSELAKGLSKHGVHVERLQGLSYRPLTRAWAITNDLSVNYLAFAVKPGKRRKTA